jgi:CDP-glucose 4,6-dehydratase
MTVLDVIDQIQKQMGTDLAPLILNEARNEIPVQCLDAKKAKEQLNWKPAFGFEAGVDKSIAWYKETQPKI